MPCIQMKTNVVVSPESAGRIKSRLGELITNLPGKSEEWLMIALEDRRPMWFRGKPDAPLAFVEVKIFGDQVDREGSEKMTAGLCALLQQELDVNTENLYVCYTATTHWGWNGGNF